MYETFCHYHRDFTAVIKRHDYKQLGEEMVYSVLEISSQNPSFKVVRAVTQYRNPEMEIMIDCFLLMCSSRIAQFSFLYTLGPPTNVGTPHSELNISPSIIN